MDRLKLTKFDKQRGFVVVDKYLNKVSMKDYLKDIKEQLEWEELSFYRYKKGRFLLDGWEVDWVDINNRFKYSSRYWHTHETIDLVSVNNNDYFIVWLQLNRDGEHFINGEDVPLVVETDQSQGYVGYGTYELFESGLMPIFSIEDLKDLITANEWETLQQQPSALAAIDKAISDASCYMTESTIDFTKSEYNECLYEFDGYSIVSIECELSYLKDNYIIDDFRHIY